MVFRSFLEETGGRYVVADRLKFLMANCAVQCTASVLGWIMFYVACFLTAVVISVMVVIPILVAW